MLLKFSVQNVGFLRKYLSEVMVDVSFRLNRSQSSVGKNLMLIEKWVYTYVVSNKKENQIPCSPSAECTEVIESNWACAYYLDSQFSWQSLSSLKLLVATNLSGYVYIWDVNVIRWSLCMMYLWHCKRMVDLFFFFFFFYLCNSTHTILLWEECQGQFNKFCLGASRPGTQRCSYRNKEMSVQLHDLY